MKNFIKYILQKILGYQRYLFVFAKYKIKNLRSDKKEGDFFAFMNEIVGDGDLMDVGANIGIMTYHLSKTFPNRAIYAIEPMPSNISVLQKIVSTFGLKNVDVLETAVGDKDDEKIEMVLPKQGSVKFQGLAHVVHDSITEWNEGDKFTMTSNTLDKLVGERRIAGIKMDIENYEHFALQGAKVLLERDHPVVYLELWENDNRDLCFSHLESFGYKAYVQVDTGLELYNPAEHTKQNFIFKVDK